MLTLYFVGIEKERGCNSTRGQKLLGMIMGAAASTEKYLYRSGVGQSRSSAGIKLTIVVCL
ncbi:hypothetical protein V6Z11_1Z113300 [Gossypium hirsutum]